jgi:hypothetical protein
MARERKRVNTRNGTTKVPGSTRGEQTPSNFAFNQWPYMVSGQTSYDPSSTQPGSNLSAVQQGTKELARKAGVNSSVRGNPSGLNGMPSN